MAKPNDLNQTKQLGENLNVKLKEILELKNHKSCFMLLNFTLKYKMSSFGELIFH